MRKSDERLIKMASNIRRKLKQYGDVWVSPSTIYALLDNLTERQREIVELYYLDNMKTKKIAELKAISTCRIYQIIRAFNLKVLFRSSSDARDNLYELIEKGVPTAFIYALRRGGYHTVEEVSNWLKKDSSNREHIRGIGVKAINDLQSALKN